MRYFSSANGVSIHLASCKFRSLSFGPTVQTHHSCAQLTPASPSQLSEHGHTNNSGHVDMQSPAGSPLYDAEKEDNEIQESVEYHPTVNGTWNLSWHYLLILYGPQGSLVIARVIFFRMRLHHQMGYQRVPHRSSSSTIPQSMVRCIGLNLSAGILTTHLHHLGRPCDKDGFILPDGTPPPPFLHGPPDDFTPFDDCPSFELADLLYRRNQMPASQINDLLQIWCANACNGSESAPFANANDLYHTIDATTISNVPWQSFTVSFNGDLGEGEPPAWKTAEYEVFFRDPRAVLQNQLGNPDFACEMDFSPKQVTDRQGKRCYMDFMSGNWAWKQAVSDSASLNFQIEMSRLGPYL